MLNKGAALVSVLLVLLRSLGSRSFVVVAMLAAVSTVGAATTHGAASAGSVPVIRNGQIAWKEFPRAGDESTSSIYAANADGSFPRRLTHGSAGVVDDLPDWSPDGSYILFERIFQSSTNPPTIPDQVMRLNADGTGLRQIGTCAGACLGNDDPQYSPDGQQIVFTRAIRTNGSASIELGVWLMGANGENPHEISRSLPGGFEDHEPAWSPDAKHVVFTRLNDSTAPANKQALFIIAVAGGEPRRITPWALNAGGANWSPRGTTILFQSYRDCSCSQTSQVYTVAVDGSNLKQLTNRGRNIEPNWSPDGKKIIYAHQPGTGAEGPPDLWVMDSTGKNTKTLTQTNQWESEPDWGTAKPVS